jgi:hypothetical protein
MESRGNDPP